MHTHRTRHNAQPRHTRNPCRHPLKHTTSHMAATSHTSQPGHPPTTAIKAASRRNPPNPAYTSTGMCCTAGTPRKTPRSTPAPTPAPNLHQPHTHTQATCTATTAHAHSLKNLAFHVRSCIHIPWEVTNKGCRSAGNALNSCTRACAPPAPATTTHTQCNPGTYQHRGGVRKQCAMRADQPALQCTSQATHRTQQRVTHAKSAAADPPTTAASPHTQTHTRGGVTPAAVAATPGSAARA